MIIKAVIVFTKEEMEQNMNFDNEVLAYLSTRKDELMTQHDEYIAEHPEIREVLNDFLSSVLLSKPVSFLFIWNI